MIAVILMKHSTLFSDDVNDASVEIDEEYQRQDELPDDREDAVSFGQLEKVLHCPPDTSLVHNTGNW